METSSIQAQCRTRARRAEVQKVLVAKAKAKRGQTVLATAAAGIVVCLVTSYLAVLGSEQESGQNQVNGGKNKGNEGDCMGSGPRGKVKASTKSRWTTAMGGQQQLGSERLLGRPPSELVELGRGCSRTSKWSTIPPKNVSFTSTATIWQPLGVWRQVLDVLSPFLNAGVDGAQVCSRQPDRGCAKMPRKRRNWRTWSPIETTFWN